MTDLDFLEPAPWVPAHRRGHFFSHVLRVSPAHRTGHRGRRNNNREVIIQFVSIAMSSSLPHVFQLHSLFLPHDRPTRVYFRYARLTKRLVHLELFRVVRDFVHNLLRLHCFRMEDELLAVLCARRGITRSTRVRVTRVRNESRTRRKSSPLQAPHYAYRTGRTPSA